jgi:hypothetical protein
MASAYQEQSKEANSTIAAVSSAWISIQKDALQFTCTGYMIVLGRFMFPNCPVWKGITDNNLSVIVIKTFIKKEKKM